jgi:hypothetical protein
VFEAGSQNPEIHMVVWFDIVMLEERENKKKILDDFDNQTD